MSLEQKELDLLPGSSEIRRPRVPVLDTQEMIDHMLEGSWQIPTEPYTPLERIRENDLDFMKEYQIESFQEQCRETVSEWIPFLDKAERGYQINKRFIEEGILKPDVDSIQTFQFLQRAFEPRFKQNKGLGFEEVVGSVRSAFLHLLTDGWVERLGHKRPDEISQEDIENAKFLVDRMSMYGTIFFPPFLENGI